jgi:hypothetical protein
MAMTMTSRQRVLAALHHEEPDRVPIFFGSSGVTTMNTAAYDRMKAHLGIKSETKTFWRALQYAILDEEVMVRFHSDARSIIPVPRLDGRRLGITGTVTAVNAAAGYDATMSLTPDEPYRIQTSTNLQRNPEKQLPKVSQ